jgi:hypothetical protein
MALIAKQFEETRRVEEIKIMVSPKSNRITNEVFAGLAAAAAAAEVLVVLMGG